MTFFRQPVRLLILAAATSMQGQTQASNQGQRPAPPPIQSMIDHETLLLQFYGGGTPLTSPERDQAEKLVRDALRDPEAHWLDVDKRETAAVATLQSGDRKAIGALWDSGRYAYQFTTADGPLHRYVPIEKQIIEAHDPVLFLDVGHHRVFTRHMLIPLKSAATWTATMYHLGLPGPGFDEIVRTNLRQITNEPEAIADGTAHIALYQPYVADFFASLPAATQTAFFNDKTPFKDLDKPENEAWQLAQTGAMVSRFAARQTATHSTAKDLAYGMKMQNMWLGNAARGLSSACNPSVSTADRMESNCMAPIPVPGVH